MPVEHTCTCTNLRSTSPTAFTGYSFHVLEAMLVFANEVFVCFLLPMPIELHRLYHLFTTVIHNGMQCVGSSVRTTTYVHRGACGV